MNIFTVSRDGHSYIKHYTLFILHYTCSSNVFNLKYKMVREMYLIKIQVIWKYKNTNNIHKQSRDSAITFRKHI